MPILRSILGPILRPITQAVTDAGGGGATAAWWVSPGALAVYDPGEGAGKGYTNSAGSAASILELSGNGSPLTPGTGMGVITQVNGRDAVLFDGGTATRGYSGANPAVGALFAGTPYATFSLHHTVRWDTIANAYIMSTTPSPAVNNPAMWSNHNANGLHSMQVNSTAGGNDAIASGPVRNYSAGDTALKSVFYEGPTGLATVFLNGEINNLYAPTTVAGHTLPMGFNRVTVGSLLPTSASGGLVGAFAAGAIYAHSSHSLAEASNTHRKMIDRWMPSLKQQVFTVLGYGQSNTVADYPNTDPVLFADGTAYGWLLAASGTLSKTGIGHAFFGNTMASSVYFAKEIQRLIGGIPIVTSQGSGGLALVGGSTGTSSYLEPQTAAGDAAGATSSYTSNLPNRSKLRDLVNYTPRFSSELFRVVLWIGCETDVQNLVVQKVAGVVPQPIIDAQILEVKRALNATINAFKADLGFTHFALVTTGRRGSTLTEVQENAPLVAAINNAYQQVVAMRTNTFIVYDKNTNYSTTSFALDDIVVDGDGAWVSGAATIDGVHYPLAQYKAIGITGARNFVAAMGL